MTYPHPRNTSVMHASQHIEAVRPLTGDERRALWASKFYARGLHRGNGKPRIRVTVPSPLTPVPDHEQPAPTRAIGTDAPMPAAAGQHDSPSRVAAAGSHVCHCGDDAQRHYALIARDLMRHGRENELTDDMRQAYDYEFGGVQEPEPIQIPEF